MANKEQIIDKVYEGYMEYTILGIENGLDRIAGHLDNCLVEFDGYSEHFTNPSFAYGFRTHTQEEFINKCKTDTEFSERWGLKIEERELSYEERLSMTPAGMFSWTQWTLSNLDEFKIPTKLITTTYNNETIENYES